VPTGLVILVPEGTYGRIAPRSGLDIKHQLDIGAGVIDADYRGPVSIVIFNHSETPYQIINGDRIAQLICEKIAYPELVEVFVSGAGKIINSVFSKNYHGYMK